ncbi:hypothetical protein PRIPAC_81548, partial [Pristionchus pacificus]
IISPLFILLFLHSIHQSIQYQFMPCRDRWFCLVNAECNDRSGDKLLIRNFPINFQTSNDKKCEKIVQIRKLEAQKYVVILIYRKESPVTPISTLTMKLKISDGTSFIERFGCKIKDNKIEETLAEDAMELNKYFTRVGSNGLHTCVGYMKGYDITQISSADKMTLELKINGAAVEKSEGWNEKKKEINWNDFHSCNPLMVNLYWKETFDEDFVKKERIDLPPNRIPTEYNEPICDTTNKNIGLFYKRFVDIYPRPVKHFSCDDSNRSYVVIMNDYPNSDDVESPNEPFFLFCAENVKTKCTDLPEIKCDGCSKSQFTEGKEVEPSKLICKSGSYVVKERANELRVFGIPICKPNSDDKTKAVWTIESFEKKEISFTEVACHDGLSCFYNRPFYSTCDDEKENDQLSDQKDVCSQARVSPTEAICPSGTNVSYWKGSNWTHLKTNEIRCDTVSGEWKPKLNENKIACFFDKSRKPVLDLEMMSKRLIGILILCSILLIISIIIIVLILIIHRRRKSKKVIDPNSISCQIEEMYDNKDVISPLYEIEKMEMAKDSITVRKENAPNIEERLFTRKNESINLLFRDLSIMPPDYQCELVVTDFLNYSIYERTKFAEGFIKHVGQRMYVTDVLELYMSLLDHEWEFSVWNNLIGSFKIICISLRMNHATEIVENILLILTIFASKVLMRYGDYPTNGESYNKSSLRALAYYVYVMGNNKTIISTLAGMHVRAGDSIHPSLRRLVWACVVRQDNGFEEFKQMLNDEIANPTTKEDIRWGTKREHIIYAICSIAEREKSEPFLSMLIKEPQYTPSDIIAGFYSMVKDYDDCHDGAKFLFTERHNLIKAKMPVGSEEYKTLIEILIEYGYLSAANDDWILRFMDMEDSYDQNERNQMESIIDMAFYFAMNYDQIPESCFPENRKREDIRPAIEGIIGSNGLL